MGKGLSTSQLLFICMRQGEAVCFLKQGKSPSDLHFYWPICLLPTLGKLLVQHVTYHLEINNLIHTWPFGVRKGRFSEKALHKILTSWVYSIARGHYTFLVLLDIYKKPSPMLNGVIFYYS